MNDLLSFLEKDSITVADLGRIYSDHGATKEFTDDAIRSLTLLDSDVAWRAAWLLKELAKDGKLGDPELVRIAECADALPHWAARLNLCQLFAASGCPGSARETLFPYLADCFGNRRPMIRAWAITVLSGFRTDRRFRHSVEAMIRKARADGAASMQARLRRLGIA